MANLQTPGYLTKLKKLSREGIIEPLIVSTSIYRASFKTKKSREMFKEKSVSTITKLFKKIDDREITNKLIRAKIQNLARASNVSIGVSQKAINVCLKYYCVLSGAQDKIFRELDCPLDKNVMKALKTKGKKIPTLYEMSPKEYADFQKQCCLRYDWRIIAEREYEEA